MSITMTGCGNKPAGYVLHCGDFGWLCPACARQKALQDLQSFCEDLKEDEPFLVMCDILDKLSQLELDDVA